LRKLKEGKKKHDIKWKIASLIVRTAHEKQCAVVLEKLGRKPASNMVKRIKDKQLRHRIFQASFKGIQKAIKEKAREYGVPIIYVNPRNTSKLCPVHGTPINHGNGSRIGRCSKGGELWGSADIVFCRRMSALGRITLEGLVLSFRGLSPFGVTPGAPHPKVLAPIGSQAA